MAATLTGNRSSQVQDVLLSVSETAGGVMTKLIERNRIPTISVALVSCFYSVSVNRVFLKHAAESPPVPRAVVETNSLISTSPMAGARFVRDERPARRDLKQRISLVSRSPPEPLDQVSHYQFGCTFRFLEFEKW